MNNLAPRQGIFAVILLASFVLHVMMLMFSLQKQQYDYRSDKGEKIVQQLSKEAIVALSNQDRISLSVLANRYQVDSDVAQLMISDANKQPLVQTGQNQAQAGAVISQPIIQNNQVLGYSIITMKALSKGELLGGQWLFILASAIMHGFLWLIYGYVARPTNEQLQQIGEKVQQRIALTRGKLPIIPVKTDSGLTEAEQPSAVQPENNRANLAKSIHDFLHPTASAPSQPADEATDPLNPTAANNQPAASQTTLPANDAHQSETLLQIGFFDQHGLLKRVAPELAEPYEQLCQALLQRACASLFGDRPSVLQRYLKDTQANLSVPFGEQGAIVRLTGSQERLALASVLLAKLVIIVNQVVYEKHRELGRFALPMTAGASLANQQDDMRRLLANHAKEDGILLLYPKTMLKTLNGQVQLNNLIRPTTVNEREAARYQGLSETLMNELIRQRDQILSAHSLTP